MKLKRIVLVAVLLLAACIMTGAQRFDFEMGIEPLQEATSLNNQLLLGAKHHEEPILGEDDLATLMVGSVTPIEEEEINYEEAFVASYEEILEEERIAAEEEAKRLAALKAEEEAKAAAQKAAAAKKASSYTIVSKASVDDSLLAAGYSTLQAQVLALTNAQRAANGNKSAYVMDETLSAAASERAIEIATKFSHYRPDGSYYTSLLSAYGVSAETVEIIAWGYGTPAAAVAGWMNSTPHRRAILDLNKRGYHLAGVGVYNNNGTYYWVQYFSVQ